MVCVSVIATAAMFMSTTVSMAQTPTDEPTVAGLLKFENQWTTAEGNYDVAFLSHALAPDVNFGHGGGTQLTYDEYMASTKKSAHSHFLTGVTLSNETGVVYGNIGITNGVMDNHFKNKTHRPANYLGVYRYENGHWSLIRWQTTPIIEGPPPPAAPDPHPIP